MKKMSVDEFNKKCRYTRNFHDIDFSNEIIDGMCLVSGSFTHCIFDNSILKNCEFMHVDFYNCKFRNAVFNNTTLISVKFIGENSDISKSYFDETSKTDLVRVFDGKAYDVSINNLRSFYFDLYENVEGRETFPYACPEEGEIIGYTPVYFIDDITEREIRCVIRLLIPVDAKRRSGSSDKCRCSKAKMIGFVDESDLDIISTKEVRSTIDQGIKYIAGEWTYSDSFNDDRWSEREGLHFFMHR